MTTFDLRVTARKEAIICCCNQTTASTKGGRHVGGWKVRLMMSPSVGRWIRALRASQLSAARPLCPFKHALKRRERLHSAPDIKAPLRDPEYILKAMRFCGWQKPWTRPITFRWRERDIKRRTKSCLKNRKTWEWKKWKVIPEEWQL